MIEELLWVVRLVRMIFSAGVYSKRVQIISDLHPFFFSGERGSATLMPCTFKAFHLRALSKITIPRSATKNQSDTLYSCTFRVQRCQCRKSCTSHIIARQTWSLTAL
jgi:hypothetical protein